MRCLGCGYRLDLTEAKRCPECGREFDRLKPSTMLMEPVPGLRLAIQAWIGFALVEAFLVMSAMDSLSQARAAGPGQVINREDGIPEWLDFLVMILGVAGILLVFTAAVGALRGLVGPRSRWVDHRWCCWLALVPIVLFPIDVGVGGMVRLVWWVMGR
jgi:hypothetical protein